MASRVDALRDAGAPMRGPLHGDRGGGGRARPQIRLEVSNAETTP